MIVPAGILAGAFAALHPDHAPAERGDSVSFRLDPRGPATARPASVVATVQSPGVAAPPEGPARAVPVAAADWLCIVHSRAGVPIAGADVVAHLRSSLRIANGVDVRLPGDNALQFVTDAEGAFALPARDSGMYEVALAAVGFASADVEVRNAGPHVFTLAPPMNVTGVVRGRDGRVLAGAVVVWTDGQRTLRTTTDAFGRYTFSGVSSDGGEIEVADARCRTSRQRVDAGTAGADGGTRTVDVAVDRGLRLRGEVSSQGAGATSDRRGEVALIDRWTRAVVATAPCDSHGDFTFDSLDPGRDYDVLARGEYGDTGEAPVTWPAGDSATAVVTLQPPWSLSAVVQDGDGFALPGSLVAVVRADGLPVSGTSAYLLLTAGPDGKVTVDGLVAGTLYNLIAFQPDHSIVEVGPFDTGHGVGMVAVALPASARVMGSLVDEVGHPIPNATVRVRRADDLRAPALFATTDVAGHFVVDYVAPGQVNVVAFRTGYDNARDSAFVTPSAPGIVALSAHALQD